MAPSLALKVPTGQVVHAPPATLKVPARQFTQALLVGEGTRPALHCVHDVALTVVDTLSAGQMVQEVPLTSMKVPAEHEIWAWAVAKANTNTKRLSRRMSGVL